MTIDSLRTQMQLAHCTVGPGFRRSKTSQGLPHNRQNRYAVSFSTTRTDEEKCHVPFR
jgi:hypothetical protein